MKTLPRCRSSAAANLRSSLKSVASAYTRSKKTRFAPITNKRSISRASNPLLGSLAPIALSDLSSSITTSTSPSAGCICTLARSALNASSAGRGSSIAPAIRPNPIAQRAMRRRLSVDVPGPLRFQKAGQDRALLARSKTGRCRFSGVDSTTLAIRCDRRTASHHVVKLHLLSDKMEKIS